jgi:ectoine hydroxylase-related dioxygenase (phytanoyl-CoA dioxygenase family)
MKFTKLEDKDRNFFDQNGYLIVRNALDSDMLARVTAACDRIVEQRYDPDNPDRRASYPDVLPEDEVFLPLLTCETTVPLVVQLLSFNLRFAKSHLIYNFPDPPEAKPSTDWHRDFRETPFDLGSHRYPRILIKVAYQLSDTTRLSGNTVLVPGSNNYTRLLKIPAGQNDPDNAIELELNAGDAFFFESRTWHRVGLNRTEVPRKCLMMGYSYAWISPLDYDVQPQWLLEKVTDPIARQLIGAEKNSQKEIDYSALMEWAEKYGLQRSSEIDFERWSAGRNAPAEAR